ncbi:hypothetical protein M3484_09555 [Pseudomonas sp. GX19020]|uniref:hypothetical protein n=1 Tax=Pseudomonas sp. GX19020 TaxID=2942277 RepID=UPI002019F68D|nr:hypothetical protein [Pseudomonas sp. GX19020]MCL4066818.1 hypothetical protein [Pseudomonas sp. GX19020]
MLDFLGSSTLSGATRAGVTLRLHRLDFEEVLANSQTSIYQRAVVDLAGIQSSVVGLRAVAGSAGALLELAALSDPTGSTSIARIAARHIRLDGDVLVDGSFKVTGAMIVNDAVTRVAFSEMSVSPGVLDNTVTSLVIIGGGTGINGPVQLDYIPYGLRARNRLAFTVTGTLAIQGTVAGTATIAVEGLATSGGQAGNWIALDALYLTRTISWPANFAGLDIPFTFLLTDRDGDVTSAGIGGPFTEFRVKASMPAAANRRCQFLMTAMKVEQLNR